MSFLTKTAVAIGSSLLMLSGGCISESPYETALSLAGDNRSQLEKAVSYFRSAGDTDGESAAKWIIANMPGHEGIDSVQLSPRIALYKAFSKLNDQDQSTTDSLISIYGSMSQDIRRKPDIETIDSATLVNDILAAFHARERWPWAKAIDSVTFRNYVLPYRIGDEPLAYGWREGIQKEWGKKFDSIAKLPGMDDIRKAAQELVRLMPGCEWTGLLPVGPRIGHQMIYLRYGDCQDIADKIIFFLKAAGIPAATDKVPARGNGNGFHSWASLFADETDTYAYGFKNVFPAEDLDVKYLKVIRECYAGDKDVTDFYSHTSGSPLRISLDSLEGDYDNLMLCTPSYRNWLPLTSARISGDSADFGHVGKGRIATVGSFDKKGKPRIVLGPFLTLDNGYKSIKPSGGSEAVTLYRKNSPEIGEFADRMVGAVIEISDDPDFNVTDTILRINEEPYRLFSTAFTPGNTPRRYVRYKGGRNSYCNVSELSFFTNVSDTIPLKGTPIGSEGTRTKLKDNTYPMAFDGDPYTSFNATDPDNGWCGLDFGQPTTIGKIVFTPRNRDNFIRKGDEYELFYWDNTLTDSDAGWKSSGKKRAISDSIEFTAPSGALLYLKNHTRGKDERIFIYDRAKRRQTFY